MSRPAPNLSVKYHPNLPGVYQSTGYYPPGCEPRSFQSWSHYLAYAANETQCTPISSQQPSATPLSISPPSSGYYDFQGDQWASFSQIQEAYRLHRRNANHGGVGSSNLVDQARGAKVRSLRKRYGEIAGHQVEYWSSEYCHSR